MLPVPLKELIVPGFSIRLLITTNLLVDLVESLLLYLLNDLIIVFVPRGRRNMVFNAVDPVTELRGADTSLVTSKILGYVHTTVAMSLLDCLELVDEARIDVVP